MSHTHRHRLSRRTAEDPHEARVGGRATSTTTRKNKDHDGRFNGVAQNKSKCTKIFVSEKYVFCTLSLRSTGVKKQNFYSRSYAEDVTSVTSGASQGPHSFNFVFVCLCHVWRYPTSVPYRTTKRMSMYSSIMYSIKPGIIYVCEVYRWNACRAIVQ